MAYVHHSLHHKPGERTVHYEVQYCTVLYCTVSTGSPFRLAWKIQIVASAVWLFRDHREIVRMCYKGNQTKRESDQSVARRRLADIESTAQDALTSWDTSAYHSFLFVNLVARSPLWDGGGGKNTTSARLMLERYLFWVSLAFAVGWMYRRYIRLKWNRRSTQRNIDKSSKIELRIEFGNVIEFTTVLRPTTTLVQYYCTVYT